MADTGATECFCSGGLRTAACDECEIDAGDAEPIGNEPEGEPGDEPF